MQKFNELEQSVNSQVVEFKTLESPVIYLQDGDFQFGDSLQNNVYGIGVESSTTLRNLTGYIEWINKEENEFKLRYQYAHSVMKTAIEDKDYDTIIKAIEIGFNKNKGKLDVAIVNGVIVGFYSNYNGVTHQSLVQQIKENALSNRVSFYTLDETDLKVYVNFSDNIEDALVKYTFVIFNNLNAGKGLGYRLHFITHKLAFEVEFKKDTKRHLSKVSEVFDTIQLKLEEIGQLNINKTLSETNADVIIPMLSSIVNVKKEKQKEVYGRVLDTIYKFESKTALDIISYLGIISQEHGYKLIARDFGQQIINKLFNLN